MRRRRQERRIWRLPGVQSKVSPECAHRQHGALDPRAVVGTATTYKDKRAVCRLACDGQMRTLSAHGNDEHDSQEIAAR